MIAPTNALPPESYRDLVRRALAEDIGALDITTAATVDPEQQARATFIAKSHCVVAGLEVAIEAFRQLDAGVQVLTHHHDGALCAPGTVVAGIGGRAAALLTAERTALNYLQRLSGIATLTRAFVEATQGRMTVLDTRKTTPLMRTLEKYAVRAGGGTNHRFGLSDGILIKDNHVRLAGGVAPAVERMRAARRGLPIEIEVQDMEQLDAALAIGVDIILLDNLTTPQIIEAVGRCAGRVKTEISGGVTLSRMPELIGTDATFVSIGALTHSAPAADISLEIEPA
jgi:nicotinate-nucleotide pyrophosphorylase (carboxylating)